MGDFILVFDIPRDMKSEKVKVWRDLNKLGAKMFQYSVWKSSDLKSLIGIASFIKKLGGSASILEEKLIF